MICPRCGNSWDGTKGLCTNCGLVTRRLNPVEGKEKTTTLPQKTPRPFSTIRRALPETPFPPLSDEVNVVSSLSSRFQVKPLASEEGSLLIKPGTLLRGGRYRLLEMQERQEWLHDAYETRWVAQDAQRAGNQIMIRELVLPEHDTSTAQSILRTATIALTSIGKHSHLPILRDAFNDHGHSFFVFEPLHAESLAARMRRTGRAIPEQEVIEMCLQMTEVLDLLWQQNPPLVHGLIRPEYILIGRSGSQYTLTNFSIVLAGGATQCIAGIAHTFLSPYTDPEFGQERVDGRSDIYALLATTYFAVTGSVPLGDSGSIPSAQHHNPNVSAQLAALIARGLYPDSSQRYQRPSELRQELLAIRSGNALQISGKSSTLIPNTTTQQVSVGRQQFETLIQLQLDAYTPANTSDLLIKTFRSLVPDEETNEKTSSSLPRSEALPSMSERNNRLQAILLLGGIVVCLVLIVIIIGRGLV